MHPHRTQVFFVCLDIYQEPVILFGRLKKIKVKLEMKSASSNLRIQISQLLRLWFSYSDLLQHLKGYANFFTFCYLPLS